MANISAADVKRLRELTGAGMMDCKRALEENDGDFDKAVEFLRVKGQAKAAKRDASRTASNGLVAAHVEGGVGTLVEINSETDFVAKSEPFQRLAQQVLDQAVTIKAADVPTLLASEVDGRTVAALVEEANATIGEKIEVRRVARLEAAHVASYLHRTSPDLPPQVGVLLATDGESPVARDVAMHIAAMQPTFVTRDDVPAELVENERRLADETARNEGKPEAALPRIVEGRLQGFFKEAVLVEQPFAKDTKKTVGAVLTESGVKPLAFVRYRVGV